MAIRYKALIKEMYEAHPDMMTELDTLHRAYALDQKKNQPEFNRLGGKAVEVMRDYERKLCGKSERAGMGVYSSKLAETFWKEIKKRYPLIDFVGVTIT